MSFTNCLVIMAGRALGTLARYVISVLALPISGQLPWGTIIINITGSLLIGASVPDFRADERAATREIPGLPPNQIRLEPGCRFAERCELVEAGCRLHRPPLQTISASTSPHRVACPVVLKRRGIAVHV